jgi:hypothetical protein
LFGCHDTWQIQLIGFKFANIVVVVVILVNTVVALLIITAATVNDDWNAPIGAS